MAGVMTDYKPGFLGMQCRVYKPRKHHLEGEEEALPAGWGLQLERLLQDPPVPEKMTVLRSQRSQISGLP